jgi:integrase
VPVRTAKQGKSRSLTDYNPFHDIKIPKVPGRRAIKDRQIWDRGWALAVAESGIPFKPTAYQLRHTHASWLIDAGENPKAVMHRLGQADLRTTARYVLVLDETGESAARRFEGLLPPL